MQETFLDRLKKEQDSLSDNISKLSAFMDTESFNKLSVGNASLLGLQLIAMEEYSRVLSIRIELNDK